MSELLAMTIGFSDGDTFGAHLFTHWNTILYVDPETGAIRHGPPEDVPWNLILVVRGGGGADCSAGVLVSGCCGGGAASRGAGGELRLAEASEALVFESIPLNRESIQLNSEGLYLCAESGGGVTLSRERADLWETFRIAFLKKHQFEAATPVFDTVNELFSSSRASCEREPVARMTSGGRRAVICDISWLEKFIAREHYHFINRLYKDHGFDIVDSMKTDFKRPSAIRQINRYEAVLIAYQGEVEIPTNLITTHTAIKIDDLESYNLNYTRMLGNMSRHADLIVGPYAYDMKKYFPHRRVEWVPYTSSVEDDSGHIEYNSSPIEKILISGSIAWDRPFREFVFHLDDPRLEKIDHPGYGNKYDKQSEEYVGDRWFRLLNDYLCGFCDAHSLRYIHLKAFEISSVGSLLLADRLVEPEMNQLGFFEGETCVFCDASDFAEKVTWTLDPANRAHVDRIRRSGMEMCLARHTTEQRAKEFAELIDRELGQRDE